MPPTDRSYAVKIKQIKGSVNVQFLRNKPTSAQENSQPGATEQSYRTERIFGQIPVDVDNVVKPACCQ